MPSDEYASVGALRLKGGKVKKHKKKKDKGSDLEKNLSTGESSKDLEVVKKRKSEEAEDDEATRAKPSEEPEEEEDSVPQHRKTEAERRFEEARRKKLLELSESANSRPELLKTHKERVEELNTYLSKLSEHHDMPKIGPG
ncbi:putative duf1754-domain-containing protein [Phaeoacremonium minimum UCRPA7]|uniref:Putative duf1754-domain-containing protein n=1 Tax=Phaeoacremonium minimum (strain UCR-PA7) TaxID=1286976 RepID=R8BED9_PHAM7|nr:putative duf1754-domain-containing protein [Phaeoacremonium minimum UCRPA7]EON97663.1 putative duf1754-domain-containing protein [Phaeoacremonium minimum UCRPA7]